MVRYWPPKSNWLFQYSRRRSTTAAELTDRQTNASDPMKIVGEHPQYVLISVKHNKPYSMRSIHQADLGLQWHFLLFWASSLRCSISLHDFSLALHWWAYFLTRPIYLFFSDWRQKRQKPIMNFEHDSNDFLLYSPVHLVSLSENLLWIWSPRTWLVHIRVCRMSPLLKWMTAISNVNNKKTVLSQGREAARYRSSRFKMATMLDILKWP